MQMNYQELAKVISIIKSIIYSEEALYSDLHALLQEKASTPEVQHKIVESLSKIQTDNNITDVALFEKYVMSLMSRDNQLYFINKITENVLGDRERFLLGCVLSEETPVNVSGTGAIAGAIPDPDGSGIPGVPKDHPLLRRNFPNILARNRKKKKIDK